MIGRNLLGSLDFLINPENRCSLNVKFSIRFWKFLKGLTTARFLININDRYGYRSRMCARNHCLRWKWFWLSGFCNASDINIKTSAGAQHVNVRPKTGFVSYFGTCWYSSLLSNTLNIPLNAIELQIYLFSIYLLPPTLS